MSIVKLQGEAEMAKHIYYEVDTTLGTPIGEDGMGRVYVGRCVNILTGKMRPVAIKTLFSGLPTSCIEYVRHISTICLRSNNLIEILGFVETNASVDGMDIKRYYVVTELLTNLSLSDAIEGNCKDVNGNEVVYARELFGLYKFDIERFTKTVIVEILSGLQTLHDHSILYLDLYPSDIILAQDGHLKLMMSHIARTIEELEKEKTQELVCTGHPSPYAALEQILGDIKSYSPATDIYAVGILMFQLLVGHLPFEGNSVDVIDKQLHSPLPLKLIKNKALRRIVERATQKSTQDRFQSAVEMKHALYKAAIIADNTNLTAFFESWQQRIRKIFE